MSASRKNHASLAVESLETRQLMAASLTASISKGVLKVEGTKNADVIKVLQTNGNISVSGLKISDGGKNVDNVAATRVSRIEVYGLEGDDNIRLDSLNIGGKQAITKPALVYGGLNNDQITGTDAADSLYGGDGNDKIWGEKGNDFLYGEAGADQLSGNDGRDYLSGGTGRDRFFGGGGETFAAYENWDTYKDEFDLTKFIHNTASVFDIVQGETGNCQTLAAMATMADQGGTNAIKADIRHLGGSRFEVRLWGEKKQWTPVTFDGTWTDNDPSPNAQERFLSDGSTEERSEFWTILMSRARLSTFGISSFQHYTDEQWKAVNKKYNDRLTSSPDALRQFTGWTPSIKDMSKVTYEQLEKSLKAGDWVVASSFSADKKKGANAAGIIGGHAYAVTKVFAEGGKRYVQLYNPWGSDSESGLKIDQNVPASKAEDDGRITLEWSVFTSKTNFSQVYIA